ncbi:MAG: hypothetical protein EOO11_19700 [Chitinophagaceae bacterium]|nr:MAG: hypothetical protein EOO11_19700 [Chitinophagaceae bacterium]
MPETTEEDEESDGDDDDEEEDARPPDDEELKRRKARKSRKSRAERLPKSQRTAEAQLARVTAYCTAQSYKLRSMATFVKDQHGAKTKLYDDCLYCVYQLPLLGGSDGYRVRSSPVVKNPGGRSVLDEQIEANERREYREGWRDESDEYSVVGNESYNTMMQEQQEAVSKRASRRRAVETRRNMAVGLGGRSRVICMRQFLQLLCHELCRCRLPGLRASPCFRRSPGTTPSATGMRKTKKPHAHA